MFFFVSFFFSFLGEERVRLPSFIIPSTSRDQFLSSARIDPRNAVDNCGIIKLVVWL